MILSKPLVPRLATRNAPVKFESMTDSKSSSDMRSTSASFVIPALHTKTSGIPQDVSIRVNASSTLRVDVTSIATQSKPGTDAPEREPITT